MTSGTIQARSRRLLRGFWRAWRRVRSLVGAHFGSTLLFVGFASRNALRPDLQQAPLMALFQPLQRGSLDNYRNVRLLRWVRPVARLKDVLETARLQGGAVEHITACLVGIQLARVDLR
jgi:hypothetical protein